MNFNIIHNDFDVLNKRINGTRVQKGEDKDKESRSLCSFFWLISSFLSRSIVFLQVCILLSYPRRVVLRPTLKKPAKFEFGDPANFYLARFEKSLGIIQAYPPWRVPWE